MSLDKYLLTKEEMQVINDAQPSDAKYGEVFNAIAQAQLDKVKEWLNSPELREVFHNETCLTDNDISKIISLIKWNMGRNPHLIGVGRKGDGMRIISFTKKWDKLQNPIFTTYRQPRLDRDWFVGEQVQVYYKSRTPERERLGIAKIIDKKLINPRLPNQLTEQEAIDDGFTGVDDMLAWLQKTYGIIPILNKLTLEWVERGMKV